MARTHWVVMRLQRDLIFPLAARTVPSFFNTLHHQAKDRRLLIIDYSTSYFLMPMLIDGVMGGCPLFDSTRQLMKIYCIFSAFFVDTRRDRL